MKKHEDCHLAHVFVGGDAKAAVVQHFDHGMYMVVFENGRPAQ